MGQDDLEGVCSYLADTVKVSAAGLLELARPHASSEELFTQLMRATEAARRERRNRVAAGDESAMLKLTPQAKGGGKGQWDKGKGKGGKGPDKGGGKGGKPQARPPAPAYQPQRGAKRPYPTPYPQATAGYGPLNQS